MQNLKRMLTKFENIVSPVFCNTLARKHGLVMRSTSKLSGYEFAQSMMIPNGFLKSETLNSLAIRMKKINKKCDLSAPALAQRINTTKAVAFMKVCYEQVLKEVVKEDFFTLSSDLANLSNFKRVLIEDSTQVELHENLSPH